MSFEQIIENYRVTFREEEGYLQCRTQYLQYCKDAVMPEVTFLQFIRGKMYDEKCVVENVVSLIDYYVPLENSYAVGDDSNTFSVINDHSLIANLDPDIHIYGNLYVDGNITQGNQSTTSTTVDHGLFTSWPVDNSMVTYTTHANPEEPKEEQKDEEPPDDPIKNRWDILDL